MIVSGESPVIVVIMTAGSSYVPSPYAPCQLSHEPTDPDRQLREINASLDPGEERLHWFGWDIDATYAGGGYAEARTILEPHRGAPVVDELLTRLTLVPAEAFTEEAERLEAALALMADREVELQGTLGPADSNLLRHVVRNLINSLSLRELAFREPFGRYWKTRRCSAVRRPLSNALTTAG